VGECDRWRNKIGWPANLKKIVGAILAPHGRLTRALKFTIENGKIKRLEVIGERARLNELELSVLAG